MPIQSTSAEAYAATVQERRTWEKRLYALYQKHREGLTDREAANILGTTPSTISARRNGLGGAVQKVTGRKDPETRKRVWAWGVQ